MNIQIMDGMATAIATTFSTLQRADMMVEIVVEKMLTQRTAQ